jgi:hypothetical protein
MKVPRFRLYKDRLRKTDDQITAFDNQRIWQ